MTSPPASEYSKQKTHRCTQNEFKDVVHNPHKEGGINAPKWTPALVQIYLEETYNVEFSIQICRRRRKEAGLNYQKLRRSAAEADENEQEKCHDELKGTQVRLPLKKKLLSRI